MHVCTRGDGGWLVEKSVISSLRTKKMGPVLEILGARTKQGTCNGLVNCEFSGFCLNTGLLKAFS